MKTTIIFFCIILFTSCSAPVDSKPETKSLTAQSAHKIADNYNTNMKDAADNEAMNKFLDRIYSEIENIAANGGYEYNISAATIFMLGFPETKLIQRLVREGYGFETFPKNCVTENPSEKDPNKTCLRITW